MAVKLPYILSILKRYKFYLIGALAFIVLTGVVADFLSKPIKNTANQDMVLNIRAMGGLPALDVAMKDNRRLRGLVKQLLDIDEAALFSNYKTVDNVVTEAMFLWIGFTPDEIKTVQRQKLAEIFIRRYYNLPPDEPIKNNPMLGKRPWYGLFQSIKAKILMQGHGHKIFDGTAYYDNQKNKMVVQGGISLGYLESLSNFIKTQETKTQRGLINNYLFYIDNTLGLKNLNKKERDALRQAGFIRI